MEKLTPHITIAEATHSNTAKRLGIENKPTDEHLGNMLTVGQMIFEPLREYVGGPIKINSFYRSPELNKAIKENLDFDQMICEFGDMHNPSWVHVSYVDAQQNRKRCLKAYKENGKTRYSVI